MEQKIGVGYDIHRLQAGRELILGGEAVPYTKGLDGHSDADVLLHAVCDAILGALGRGDIGEHFPDTEERYRGISSRELLAEVHALAREAGFTVGNVDTVVIAQEPNLKDVKPRIRSNIAQTLEVDADRVNIKATTPEKLGPLGSGEGIAAYAVVLLVKDGR